MKNRVMHVLIFSFIGSCLQAQAAAEPRAKTKIVMTAIEVPFERPIAFTVNLAAISSMTFEGRFLLGLAPNLSLVISPNFQKTPRFPFYHPERKEWSAIDFMRLNLGAGLRGHFYEYDSYDGWFIEGMARAGGTSIGTDPFAWSIIPSLILGYAIVYDSGYTASFGFGFEYEFLLGTPGPKTEFLQTAYLGLSKLPLTGEISVGWTW